MINEALNKLIVSIKQTQKDANIVLESVEGKTLPAWTIRKNQAKEQLQKEKREYTDLLSDKILHLFVVGSIEHTQKFAFIANKEANTAIVHADALFTKLGNRIYSSLGPDKQAGVMQMDLLANEVYQMDEQLGLKLSWVDNLPASFLQKINDIHDADKWVRTYLLNTLGFDFLKEILSREITDAAIAREFNEELFPVVILGLSESEVDTLKSSTKQSFKIILNSDREVTKELVFGTLKEIKSIIKNKETK